MSGFAEEISQSRTARRSAPENKAADPASSPAAETKPELPGPESAVVDLATGTKPVEGEVKKLEPTMEPIEELVEKKTAPIKIAGKEFSSVEEAIAYAEQLEIAQREEKAFQEGYEKAAKKDTPEPAKKSLDEEVEEILFENPKAAVQKLREGITKEIFAAYDKMTEAQRAQAIQEQQKQETWNNFYKENSDLAESRDYVEFLLQKNWQTLSPKPAHEALKELAEMARKNLKLSREASLPKQELQSKPAIMAGVSGDTTAAQQVSTETEKVDFISQIAKLRKRK